MTSKKEHYEVLACPKCTGDVLLTDKQAGLVCDKCNLFYPIKNGIPVMLVEEAISLNNLPVK